MAHTQFRDGLGLVANIPGGCFSTPLSSSFTCHTCGKLGWEQPNCFPTASVWEGGSHLEIGVSRK